MTTPIHEKEFPSDEQVKLPRPFILRRLHSILGLWLVIYLFEHLLVNSQMALYFQDEGSGFIRMVNSIHALPYLKVIEIVFLGLPFLIHGAWGVWYALSGKSNSRKTDGTKPALPQYKRNKAYTWQRITSWILLVGILAHVVQMRFVEYPTKIQDGDKSFYFIQLQSDPGLARVAKNLNVQLSTEDGQVIAKAPSMGAAFFLIVRQVFTSPMMVVLYSIFVVVATYHAFNGLWTLMITWGITLTRRSQKTMRKITTTLMAVVMFLGLMSAWGTYWTNVILK